MYRYISIAELFLSATNECNGSFKRLYSTGKTKEYEGRKLIGFSMDQMYNVVADVANYKKFVPFCKKSDIITRNDEFLKANLVIGFPPLNESYTSKDQ
ncbi:coenzyme Q-binding protein COQ10, mitochondrial isoform X2 [Cephus cinctus]|uniref:Coenzyme Q-binding protein COQ10, mitochondrial isoform X2 n=1 Tax=Cephus cinctus TaxID=211228 RepID=A0AAJ7RL09_CEPCN|nr:coenzyme Q-binding protein COQ10, mitochondrial isoform X2 [Cephus cinctus]